MIEKVYANDLIEIYVIENDNYNEEGSCGECSCCKAGESDCCDLFFN